MDKIREQLVNSYGITHDELEDKWKVQESELRKIVTPAVKKSTDECEGLPSRKRLLRRVKKLAMSFAGKGSGPGEDKDESPQDSPQKISKKVEMKHGFFVIDQQTDRHNSLLAAMIRGQLLLKRATKVATIIEYSTLIFDEIDARIEALTRSDDEDLMMIQVLEKTRTDLQLYLNTFRKCPRASKNILRVMVSVEMCCKFDVLHKSEV